jgi:hypothetical protein
MPEGEEIEPISIPEIDIMTSHNVRMSVVDTFLIIQTREEPIVRIYSTSNHKLLFSFGKQGRGPKEFIRPSLMKQIDYSKENQSPIIRIYDFQRKKLKTVNLLKAISSKETEQLESIPGDRFLPYLHFINDDFYLASPENGAMFVMRDLNSEEEVRIPFSPELPFHVPESDIGSIFSTNATAVNTDMKLIATAPLLLGELNFFDFDGNLVNSTVFQKRDKFKDELMIGTSAVDQTMYQIGQLDTKDGLIYALNFNASISDFNQGKASPLVQIFDWKGSPKKVLKLGSSRITSFAVDSDNSRIYTYSPNEENNSIKYYNFKKP